MPWWARWACAVAAVVDAALLVVPLVVVLLLLVWEDWACVRVGAQ
jgi:hypothetical protein